MTITPVELTLPKPNRRSEIWRVIRGFKGKTFTRTDIQLALDWKPEQVEGLYLTFLVDCGFLSVLTVCSIYHYQLIKDAGIDSPRFTKKGALIVAPTVQENIWRTIRMLKQFTINGLTAHSSTSYRDMNRATVNVYVRFLKIAGYLRIISNKKNERTFQLVRDSGPKAPQILKAQEVYDPNINQIVYREVPDAE